MIFVVFRVFLYLPNCERSIYAKALQHSYLQVDVPTASVLITYLLSDTGSDITSSYELQMETGFSNTNNARKPTTPYSYTQDTGAPLTRTFPSSPTHATRASKKQRNSMYFPSLIHLLLYSSPPLQTWLHKPIQKMVKVKVLE